MRAVGRAEVSPVSDRLLVLQFVRILVIVALLGVPVVSGAPTQDMAAIALVYLVFTLGIEPLRRRSAGHAAAFMSWTVLLDGVVICLAIALSGGYRSPLLFLVFLDVMGVTLVASYRTGLKLVVWCA
ncbi:MAG TPA: hypothetical protein VGA62_11715, partial [Acidimicrobiia bacterium]